MLRNRIITAVIGGSAILAAFIYLPAIFNAAIFMTLGLFCAFEVTKMMYPRLLKAFHPEQPDEESTLKSRAYKWHVVTVLCIGVIIFVNIATMTEVSSGRGILVGGLLACVFLGTFTSQQTEISGVKMLSSIFAIVYGVLPWVAIWDIYLMGENAKYLFLLIAIVWSSDTGAYFGGRYFGKHKLSPSRSPKKTWEGAIAGLLSSVVAAMALKLLYQDSYIAWEWVVAAAIICGILSQMGDLIESTIKRFCDVKDSGGILPGHGGILDRADGLLFAGPALWFILFSILN